MANTARDMKGRKGGKGDAEEEAEGVFAYRENAECEICGGKEKRLRRDRNRKTGRARGMLCRRCTAGVWAIESGIAPGMEEREDIERLKKHILPLGGRGFQVDWFLDRELPPGTADSLIGHGQAFDGRGAIPKRMERNACHENAMRLAEREGYSAWFGFALSDDGIWRIHSWATNEGKAVVETTEPRVLYYGMRAVESGIVDKKGGLKPK